MKNHFNISVQDHTKLKDHLFPGDGKEAVAIALCGRCINGDYRGLTVHEIFLIPYEKCMERTDQLVHWPPTLITPLLEKAEKKSMSIAKIHCHPEGYGHFSRTDDISDFELFDSVHGWVTDDGPHASLVMLPDGKLFGRFIEADLSFTPIDRIRVVGDDVFIWDNNFANEPVPEHSTRTAQAFGKGTTNLLSKMRIGVVGCSGTGSPIIEQLHRFNVGELVLVDPDKVEDKNLNRIINTTKEDIGFYKVNVLKDAIERTGMGTIVHAHPVNLFDSPALINDLATCDFIFGCMDSIDGRHLLNTIASFYIVPYIDIGVKLIADGRGGVDQIFMSVHYLLPGQSLLKRGVFTVEELKAVSMHRSNPYEYKNLRKEGYIANADNVESPAVINVNMEASAKGIHEFMARVHHFRSTAEGESLNANFALNTWETIDPMYIHKRDENIDTYFSKYAGRGDMSPLLNMPELTQIKVAA